MKRVGRPKRRTGQAGTRERLFAAAATEFAARGFAGANVDRIAAAARVNKAMLYYHFKSKAGLYREILRDMFQAVADRVGADAAVDAERREPGARVTALVEAIGREAEARPHFPSIWLREIADGGARIDKDTLAIVSGILGHLVLALQEGVASRRFTPAHPLLVQFGIVGPLLLFFATAPLRRRAPEALKHVAQLSTDDVITHVQRVALLTLEGAP